MIVYPSYTKPEFVSIFSVFNLEINLSTLYKKHIQPIIHVRIYIIFYYEKGNKLKFIPHLKKKKRDENTLSLEIHCFRVSRRDNQIFKPLFFFFFFFISVQKYMCVHTHNFSYDTLTYSMF